MGGKKPKPGCWRCSICNLNYRDDTQFKNCVVCDEPLSHFSDIYPHDDIVDRVRKAVYHHPGRKPEYGGASALEQFDKHIESLGGADDFIFECEKGRVL